MIPPPNTWFAGPPHRAAAWAAASGLAALLLSGCAADALVSHFTPGPATLQGRVDCLASPQWRSDYGPIAPAAGLMGSVPEGFKPVEVVECRQEPRSCTSEWVDIPDLWLVDAAGKAIHVMWPLDVCSRPKPGTAKALDGLPVRSSRAVSGPAAS